MVDVNSKPNSRMWHPPPPEDGRYCKKPLAQNKNNKVVYQIGRGWVVPRIPIMN